MQTTKKRVACKRCKYIWDTRVDQPKACPDCKSRDWDKEPTQ